MLNIGNSTVFTVTAIGGSPLSYQWSFNDVNVAGATNYWLPLANAQLTNAGVYSVLVTNFYGSVNSSNALLTVNDILDHFIWNSIPSPRFVNTPFAVVIQARNTMNQLFTNFTGVINLESTNGITVYPLLSSNFVQGSWAGAIKVSQTVSNLTLRANDGLGHFGLANPINVVLLPQMTTVSSGNIFNIFWPVVPTGFVLEASPGLSPAQWVPVTNLPIQIGDQYLQSIPMTGSNQFYRLWFPGP
jgi:hypothetical protein